MLVMVAMRYALPVAKPSGRGRHALLGGTRLTRCVRIPYPLKMQMSSMHPDGRCRPGEKPWKSFALRGVCLSGSEADPDSSEKLLTSYTHSPQPASEKNHPASCGHCHPSILFQSFKENRP